MAVVTSREDSAARTGSSARERATPPESGQILEGEVIRSGRSGLVVNATLKPLGHDGPGSRPARWEAWTVSRRFWTGSPPRCWLARAARTSVMSVVSSRSPSRRSSSTSPDAPRIAGETMTTPSLACSELSPPSPPSRSRRSSSRTRQESASAFGRWSRHSAPMGGRRKWIVSGWGGSSSRGRQATLDGADRAYLALLAGPRFPRGTPAIEQLAGWEHATERWPERAEIWLHFGELLLYGGPGAGIEDSRTRAAAAFRRARQADPELAGPLLGLIEVAAFDRDSSAVEHLGSTFLTRDSVSGWADYVRWRVASVVDTQSLALLRAEIRLARFRQARSHTVDRSG